MSAARIHHAANMADVRRPVGPHWVRTIRRLPRLVVLALVIGIGISQLVLTVADWHLRDMDAYWDAAQRLRHDAPLYPELRDSEASNVYRYAPWFAWAWVPLTFLPRELVNFGWSATLLTASAAALAPLVRAKAWTAVALFAPILIGISGIGNAQPLLVAALVLGVERRSGPLWIAMASSLKVTPIILVCTYIGRRQFARAGWTLAIAACLVAPMLFYDLSAYSTTAGDAAVLLRWPLLYGVTVGIAVLVSVRLARTRHAWLASVTTVTLALPRFFVYDLTFLMAAVPAKGEPTSSVPSRRG